MCPLAEELVEERLDRRQADDVLALHHLAGRHPPSPIRVVILFEDRPDRDLDVIGPLRQRYRGLPALRAGGRRDDVCVGVAEVGVHRADREHPGAAEQVGAQQLLGRIRARQRVGVGEDRPGTSDVFVEVLEGSGGHGELL